MLQAVDPQDVVDVSNAQQVHVCAGWLAMADKNWEPMAKKQCIKFWMCNRNVNVSWMTRHPRGQASVDCKSPTRVLQCDKFMLPASSQCTVLILVRTHTPQRRRMDGIEPEGRTLLISPMSTIGWLMNSYVVSVIHASTDNPPLRSSTVFTLRQNYLSQCTRCNDSTAKGCLDNAV